MTSEHSYAFGRSWHALKTVFRRALRTPRPAFKSYSIVPLNERTILFVVALFVLVFAAFIWFDDDIAHYALGHETDRTPVFYFFRVVTNIGSSGWVLLSAAILGVTISVLNIDTMPRAKRWFWVNLHGDFNFTFFTVGVTGILASFLKHMIGRARPVHLETLGHLEFDFARFEPSFASFPSGHSTTFGALCMVLFLLLPRRLWPLWLFVAVVGGGSRIMVGAHYPSDVAAGLAFGAVATFMCARWLAKRGVMFVASERVFPLRKNR